jgi:hypothetical protein
MEPQATAVFTVILDEPQGPPGEPLGRPFRRGVGLEDRRRTAQPVEVLPQGRTGHRVGERHVHPLPLVVVERFEEIADKFVSHAGVR